MSVLNPFDAGIISFFNRFAHRSWAFDAFIELSSSYLFRVAGIVPLIWWAWFKNGEHSADSPETNSAREILLYGAFSCLVALAVSRVLSAVLPFRERPLRAPGLHFQLPYSQNLFALLGWSSFPSDHAAVYFTVAMSLYFVSRRAGLFALAWALLVTSLPRVYLGLHYPTDIIAGALIGIGVAYLCRLKGVRTALAGPFLRWHARAPGQFYAFFFLYTLQLATAFEFLRQAGDFISPLLKHALRLLHS
jgi:undecaprenyl-diphosphatase